MSGGRIAVRTIAYLLEEQRGSADVSQCELPLSSELSRWSIRKILPSAGRSSVGNIDNSVSYRAKNRN